MNQTKADVGSKTLRGSGRTTRQMLAAPDNSLFIVRDHQAVRFMQKLADHLGKRLEVICLDHADDRLQGTDRFAVVDHHVQETVNRASLYTNVYMARGQAVRRCLQALSEEFKKRVEHFGVQSLEHPRRIHNDELVGFDPRVEGARIAMPYISTRIDLEGASFRIRDAKDPTRGVLLAALDRETHLQAVIDNLKQIGEMNSLFIRAMKFEAMNEWSDESGNVNVWLRLRLAVGPKMVFTEWTEEAKAAAAASLKTLSTNKMA